MGPLVRRVLGFALVTAGFAALTQSACNAIVDTSTEQCQTTADCVNKGPEFATSTCTSDHVCSTGGDCTTNKECADRLGGLAICRRPERTCVQVTATDCTEVFPEDALSDDSTIVLGFMGPLSGEDASTGKPPWQGVQLAINEIQTNTNGIPIKNSTDHRRLAVVACDDANDAEAVATHLAKVVRVPAIFGPSFSSVTLDVSTKVTIPAGTLLISPSATSPAITDLNDNGLVWRTCPSDALQAIPIATVVSDLETQLRTALGLSSTDNIKVAMTVLGDAYGTGLANAASMQIKFNNKSAVDNGSNFLRVDYAPDTTDFTSTIDSVTAFAPNIVLLMGTTEAVTDLMPGIEAQAASPKPNYVFSDGGKIQELLDAVAGNVGLRQRVIGTAPGRTTPQYQQFRSRFKAYFANEEPGAYAAQGYDSAYLVAYALVSSSQDVPTGAGVNEGLKHTVDGTAIGADPGQVNTGFTALLADNGSINYDGVSGPLDFDVDKGEAPADIDVWCVSSGGQFVSSGQYYDSVTRAVVGTPTNCN